jgi:hypothetical protein
MIFKELETKQVYDNSYGNSSYIDRYVYYNGTEQISIYIKTGYGAYEKIINETISEHDLEEWISNFKSSVNLPTNDLEIPLTEELSSVNLPKTNISMENETNSKNFDSMREIIFDSMKMIKEGKLTPDEAKSISILGQTIINSVKVEVDFIKASGSNLKPKMIN